MIDAVAALERYDGVDVQELRRRTGASELIALQQCASTMDIAHDRASQGAPHGTVVVAEQQSAGRGRGGRTWASPAGSGVWTSVVLRPAAMRHGGVVSLRVGLELAERLEVHTASPVQLKWPNDLYVDGRKLAGILAEARWRGDQPEWIVVGVGVNVRATTQEMPVASLDGAATCADVLVAVVQATLVAGAADEVLSDAELERYTSRDLSIGRDIVAPLHGIGLGISRSGGLRVRTPDGEGVAVAGSLVFHPSDGAG